jgi:hypothetical protein
MRSWASSVLGVLGRLDVVRSGVSCEVMLTIVTDLPATVNVAFASLARGLRCRSQFRADPIVAPTVGGRRIVYL